MELTSVMKFFQTERKTIVLVTLFLWAFVLVYALVGYHPKYASQAVVIIKDSAVTNQYVLQDQMYNPKTTSSSSANPVLNTMGLLQSSTVRDALWDFFRTRHPEELKRLHVKTHRDWMKYYRDGKSLIKSKNQPGTDLISISFSWPDAGIAQEGLEVVVKGFQDASIGLSQREQESRKRFLDTRIQEITSRLKTIRQERSRYKSSVQTINLMSESEALAKSRVDMENELNETIAKAQGKEAALHRYQRTLGLSPEVALKGTAVGLDTSMSKLQDQLYSLSQNYAFLRSTLTEQNPKVQEVKAQIDQVEGQIKTEMKRTLGREYDAKHLVAVADKTRGDVVNQMVTDQAEASRYLQEAGVLRTHLGAVNQQIRALPKVEEMISNLDQEERSLSHALDTLVEKELEASLKEAENQSNVFVVDAPSYPLQARFPSQWDLVLVGFLVGLAGGCVVALMKYQMGHYLLAEEVRPVRVAEPPFAQPQYSQARSQVQPTQSIFKASPIIPPAAFSLPAEPLQRPVPVPPAVAQPETWEPSYAPVAQAPDLREEAPSFDEEEVTFTEALLPISPPAPSAIIPEIISPIPPAPFEEEDETEEMEWLDWEEMDDAPAEEEGAIAEEIEQLERLFQEDVLPFSPKTYSEMESEKIPLPIRNRVAAERPDLLTEPVQAPAPRGKVLSFASRPNAATYMVERRTSGRAGVSPSSASGSILRDVFGI